MPLDEGTFEIDRNELDRLYATIERMRKALEMVEWIYQPGDLFAYCPACSWKKMRDFKGGVHREDCPLGAALGRPECGESKGDDRREDERRA